MKNISIVFVLLSALVFTACQPTKYPQAEVSNGIIKAQIYLPDAKNGYYKATRFDWSGIISSLEYKGHNYFGAWFDENNPPPHATIMGPVEAYSPLNYNDVEPGSEFVKLGIGALNKPCDEEYTDFKFYTITNPGLWKLNKTLNEIQFVHTLNTDNYSYEYTKVVLLVQDEAKMVISHSLKNTGKTCIKTSSFNHNFFVLDDQPIGKGFELIFPENVSGEGRGLGDIFEIEGNKIVFKRDLIGDESIACKYLEGINNSVNDFDIRIENHNTGAGARITGDQPLSRVRLWGTAKTLCPETYIDIEVEPGEEFNWSYFYEFYECDIDRKYPD
jgi:hypothetical protein